MSDTTAYLKARQDQLSPQERNRAWWQALPMTYKNWGDQDRTTSRFAAIRDFREGNPYLTDSHFDRPGQSVLEIGCGAGGATCCFADAGAQMTSVDLTPAAVAMTAQHEPRAQVLEMDAEALSFPDGAFEHVFSWGVLHHSNDTEKAISEMVRVTSSGGSGLIMVYNRNSLRYRAKGLMWLFLKGRIFQGDTLDSVQRFYTDGYFHRHFTPQELRRVLQDRGAVVVRLGSTHMSKQMIPKIPRRLDNWLKARWGWLLVAEFEKPGATA